MCNLRAKTTTVRMAAVVLLFAWGLTLASPVALHAGDKKKKATTAAKPAAKKPEQDLSKLVWPEPPNIPRVRYTSYFAGMKFDKEADAPGKKAKQSWMDRLAGTQSQDEKITVKNFPFQLLGPYGMSVDTKGRLYVADQKVGAIFVFNTETKDTELIRNGFEAHFGMINSVVVDDDDRVFVSDGKLGKVLVFNAKHQVQSTRSRVPGRSRGHRRSTQRTVCSTSSTRRRTRSWCTTPTLLRHCASIGTGGKKHDANHARRFRFAERYRARQRRQRVRHRHYELARRDLRR